MADISCARRSRTLAPWCEPRRAARDKPVHAPAPAPAAAPKPTASKTGELTLIINLQRRPDRLAALNKQKLPFEWTRLDAVDGRALSWDIFGQSSGHEFAGLVHPDAVREASWAEKRQMPTICRSTGSFSPHLTLGAVGVALSQRKCWQALLESSPSTEYALILEDDISSIALDFNSKLSIVLRTLPQSWCVCFLGFHESTGQLLPRSKPPAVMELPNGACVTGLYGYIISRRGAQALLGGNALFPLRHQVDVAVSRQPWPKGTRFCIDPKGVLLTSPKSEEGACDTDIQTLGAPLEKAHRELPKSMIRL